MHNTYTEKALHTTVLAAVVFVGLAVATEASGAVLRGGQSYELDTNTTIEGDLYSAGKFFTTYGTTTGDITGGASAVKLEGAVGGDVNVMGGTVTLAGPVQGDARIVGGRVYVRGVVTEDLLVLGGNLVVEDGAVIMGDLVVFGDRLVLRGEVQGNVEGHVRTAEITGKIGSDTELYLRESLSITGDAVLGGSLSYQAPHEAFVSETTTIVGNTRYEPVEMSGGNMGFNASQIMMNIVVLFVAAVLLSTLFPVFTDRATDRAVRGGGMTILKGLLLGIAWPLASLVLIMTGIGSIPGALLFFSYLIAIFLTMALTPVLAGVVLARWLKKDMQPRWAWVSLGAISLSIIVLLPVIGWFVRLLLFFLVFGTLCQMLHEAVWLRRNNKDARQTPSAEVIINHDAKKSDTDQEASSTA